MRILILTPTALPSITGNAITAERWRRFLQASGVSAEVWATQGRNTGDLLSLLRSSPPDLIHVHHASRAGSLLLDPAVLPEARRFPMVISPGGTDLSIDLNFPDKRAVVTQLYGMCRAIISQNRETSRQVRDLFPNLGKEVVLVPKAFSWLGHEPFDLRAVAGCRPGDVLFFLPAGVRPVKGNRECLDAFKKLHTLRPRTRIVFAGPALEPEYASRFQEEIERGRSFACWIPRILPESMRSAYETCDIALNFSDSEGLSNALLEAIGVGKPVLAANVPGNRWPVLGENGDPPAGYLFEQKDPQDFLRYALKLTDDRDLRETLGHAGRERVSRWPTPDMEADGLIQVYRRVLAQRP